ncbi:MAG TPA: DMT family transporter [Gemmatimonadales bacterium]|nr:DMT family transporter [Gemmatimonadales bacterium]
MFQTALYTCLALLAFAANSVLCRLALTGGSIDPASFTLVRLASGAASLALLVRGHGPRPELTAPRWTGGVLLFLYAAPFSLAYRYLTAATGALLLFAAVQATILVASFRAGHRPSVGQWIGLGLAFSGLVYLMAPGVTAPPAVGAALMLLAGIAWGLYTVYGRSAREPLVATATNFARSLPLAVLVLPLLVPSRWPAASGLLLAALSGAGASGLGYVAWYRALRGLATLSAGVVQLAVPVLAGLGGMLVLHERITWRLAWATVLVVGGIGLALATVPRPRRPTTG